jgi:hypothetical protein
MTVHNRVQYTVVSGSGQRMNQCATLTLEKGVSTVGPIDKNTVICRTKQMNTLENTNFICSRPVSLYLRTTGVHDIGGMIYCN